ncbi:MAG: tRNA uridine-5-carboxymethylaminomethyl(34) synthesis enzyme MnmG [Chloroflexi bacterium]|nr:tRNA uridine-5-carboxymethylaminomethyl(34) synthesis enzyme MnmG [Chloroflexota bacterium]
MYDVIVVGAGHAGCEAALAAARMGHRTLLLTINMDNVALMPCNPSVGGPAKGHLVREIDALGGEMARNTDSTFIQIRMLNTGKGPAVQAPRAQADKKLYSLTMKKTLERQPNLDLKQAMVVEIKIMEQGENGCAPIRHFHVKTHLGWTYEGKTVVLTTGTSLAGRIITGEVTIPAGRAGEPPAIGLSESLAALGHTLLRLKTGTPPRIDAKTIDFSKTDIQAGSHVPLYFSLWGEPIDTSKFPEPNPVYPPGPPTPWRRQLPCYLVHTNSRTHDIIRANLNRAPLFTGLIKGVGPRYCPSIEDKVVRFAHKESHGLFLEPEGWETNEVYVQGANTSLPEDVQLAMLRTIPALERVEMMRVGYAVEYNGVRTSEFGASLESKLVPGLFFAGQICGTSGYEEAAGQGIVAGINAALKVRGKPPLILRRDQAYIGVMIDDLVTREHTEPYRLFTSRAEFRLLLRQDNADLRLAPIGYELGLIDKRRYELVEKRQDAIAEEVRRLSTSHLSLGEDMLSLFEGHGIPPVAKSATYSEFLCRSDVTYQTLLKVGLGRKELDARVQEQVEIEVKYQGFIAQQMREVERMSRLEERRIPEDLDYDRVSGLRTEARQKLARFRPATLGQATRISGVTPADMAILMVHLERGKRLSNPVHQ